MISSRLGARMRGDLASVRPGHDRQAHDSALGQIDETVPVVLDIQGDMVRGGLSITQAGGKGPQISTFTLADD